MQSLKAWHKRFPFRLYIVYGANTFIYQSIKLIKEEVDELFAQRELLQQVLYQSRKMESLGTLAGGIAHNFNNCLHMVIGSTELALQDIPEESPAYENLELGMASALKAAEIVKQLVSFSHATHQAHKAINAIDVIGN